MAPREWVQPDEELAFDIACFAVCGCFFAVGLGACFRLYRQRRAASAASAALSPARKRRPGGAETRMQFHVGIAASNFARGLTVLYATLERREHLAHYSAGSMTPLMVNEYTW